MERENGIRYTLGTSEGDIYSTNNDLSILEGVGIEYPFGRLFSPRIWNGAVIYDLAVDETDTPSQAVSQFPSFVPTFLPTTQTTSIASSSPTMPFSVQRLNTTFDGGSGLSGNMFSIVATNCVLITGLAVNIALSNPKIEVWVKEGSYKGHESDPSSWTKHFSGSITGMGMNEASLVSDDVFEPIALSESEMISLYITVCGDTGMRYTYGKKEGEIFARNDDMIIFEGIGIKYFFGDVFSPRVWNGSILYHNLSCSTPTTKAPAVEQICPPPKLWSARKEKCVVRCRNRDGLRYSRKLDKCVLSRG